MKVADGFMRKGIGDELLLVLYVARLLELQSPPSAIRRCGPLVSNADTRVCEWNGRVVPLNNGSEWRVIWTLLERPGTVVTADALAAAAHISKKGVGDVVSDIRAKLRAAGATFDAIVTVHGHGYKLTPNGPQPKADIARDQ